MDPKNQTFEASMQRLEQIVRSMEKGETELEESLKLFQEGTDLILRCSKMLDDATLQVSKIVPAANGEPTEEAFSDAL